AETERRIREQLPALTPISDGVSAAVARQYNENPYPRWRHGDYFGAQVPLPEYLHGLGVPTDHLAGANILIAGAGTGKQVMRVARQIRAARIVAVDLSAASLAFAKRQTDRAGFTGIQYGIADILRLSEASDLQNRFDMIECSGVLHHTGDPALGLANLAGCLKRGGIMHLDLYSRHARAAVYDARALITARGDAPTPEGIRAFRAHIIAMRLGQIPARPAAELLLARDFFSLSGCRDLAFNVQELTYDAAEIGALIRGAGLNLLGFRFEENASGQAFAQKYAARFPQDQYVRDIDSIAAFEQENPSAFLSMYHFFVQKP
ncbi:MAG: class I SAM-dependent methyltransferase, partial [Rhodospirillaceae bacterium]|nr:class I SAM-dependent methyltransferase [Rhodospirillaceae bacterium]